MRRGFSLLCLLMAYCAVSFAANTAVPILHHARIDLTDKATLQRGARTFINYCSGCHALKYVRYYAMAKDIGIVDAEGQVDAAMVKRNLIFTGQDIWSPIIPALKSEDATKWFGIVPPDLSLAARRRGPDWIFSYLMSFYQVSTKQWGVDNLVIENTAMPNILGVLQGEQAKNSKNDSSHPLVLTKHGDLTEQAFEGMVNDLVNFLVYVAEPAKLVRTRIGWWVLFFLVIFAVVTYFLKRAYWQDIS